MYNVNANNFLMELNFFEIFFEKWLTIAYTSLAEKQFW